MTFLGLQASSSTAPPQPGYLPRAKLLRDNTEDKAMPWLDFFMRRLCLRFFVYFSLSSLLFFEFFAFLCLFGFVCFVFSDPSVCFHFETLTFDLFYLLCLHRCFCEYLFRNSSRFTFCIFCVCVSLRFASSLSFLILQLPFKFNTHHFAHKPLWRISFSFSYHKPRPDHVVKYQTIRRAFQIHCPRISRCVRDVRMFLKSEN